MDTIEKNGRTYNVGMNEFRSYPLHELSKEDLMIEVLDCEETIESRDNLIRRNNQEWRDLIDDGWVLEGLYNLRTYFKNLKGEDGKFFNRDEEDLYTSLLIIIERIYQNVEHFDERVNRHYESKQKYRR